MIDAAAKAMGGIDAIVGNAGIRAGWKWSIGTRPTPGRMRIDRELSTQLVCWPMAAPCRICTGKSKGAIVNGVVDVRRDAAASDRAYSPAKAALIMLTEMMAMEWAPTASAPTPSVRASCTPR